MKQNQIIACAGKTGKDTLYELVYWNAVQRCNPDTCTCTELCTHPDQSKPCSVMSGYMSNVFNLMIRNFPSNLTEDVAYRIGMHLVPLYKILCRLKMQEFAEVDTIVPTAHGPKVNPIFEEIRKTIRQIEDTWKNLGFVVAEKKMRAGKGVHAFNGRDYYDVIENGGLPMKKNMDSEGESVQ